MQKYLSSARKYSAACRPIITHKAPFTCSTIVPSDAPLEAYFADSIVFRRRCEHSLTIKVNKRRGRSAAHPEEVPIGVVVEPVVYNHVPGTVIVCK